MSACSLQGHTNKENLPQWGKVS